MGRTTFQSKWMKEFSWVSATKDKYQAFCNICRKEFKIDGSGRSQVVSHQKCHSVGDGGEDTKKKKDNSNQLTFSSSGVLQPKSIVLSLDDQVATAEIYQFYQFGCSRNNEQTCSDFRRDEVRAGDILEI